MTAVEMRALFDDLQDKSNAPWFDDNEKDRYMTIAMWKIINEVIKDLEEGKDNTERIRTLIKEDSQSTDANSILLNSVFDDADGSTADPVLLMSVSKGGVPFRWVRHSDIGKFEENTYKAATSTAGSYTAISTGYKMYPSQVSQAMDIVYIMKPTAIDDLPDRMHNKQVAMAMEETGYTTEAQALVMMGEQASAE
jgi:hypothetical protein